MSLTGALEQIPVVGTAGRGLSEAGELLTTGKARNRYAGPAPETDLNRAAEAIRKAGEKWHVNSAYIWGIYGTETSFGSRISTSSTGARGPFQFEPQTARQFGYPLGVNESKITDWGAFQKQADAAARFLNAHGGTRNPRKAVEAYNPGEASYYSKVVEHAKSFPAPGVGQAATQKIADQAKEGSGLTGWVTQLLAGLGVLLLKGALISVGVVLVIYGIMVAVRPRERAFSIPRPSFV